MRVKINQINDTKIDVEFREGSATDTLRFEIIDDVFIGYITDMCKDNYILSPANGKRLITDRGTLVRKTRGALKGYDFNLHEGRVVLETYTENSDIVAPRDISKVIENTSYTELAFKDLVINIKVIYMYKVDDYRLTCTVRYL